ncbi:hypothetical protein J4E93_008828 [Alternaria ventricosa]|uniref:uncharacterized protein n=1 Tax=Alternaria ventricosa TaxID=1187951 RepID=UPI0020C56D1D|nr:uncharacterized protein J4E93_008828 [Alternaria ventricosa]KAI4640028.1 hypothetical protein J4E93_008828 [Alternaria ventricosa]
MSGQTNPQGWTEHEVLVYLLNVIDTTGVQLDYNNAPVPAGRNVNGCRQKINKTKVALKPEMDAIKAGVPLAGAADGTPTNTPTKKAATPRKRKAKVDEEGNETEVTPKKGRGRTKKKLPTPEIEEDMEGEGVKTEVKDEDDDDILKEADDI